MRLTRTLAFRLFLLIASIQAVEIAIKHQERMLAAEVLGDRTDTEEFIFILENAKPD